MVRSPSTKLLAAAGVVLFATVATIAGAGNPNSRASATASSRHVLSRPRRAIGPHPAT